MLRRKQEFEEAVSELNRLELSIHADLPKNWDTLAALSLILRNTRPDGRLLDAGGERYSSLLPHLEAYGYHHLHCLNLAFQGSHRRGNIVYEHGDITQTRFENDS